MVRVVLCAVLWIGVALGAAHAAITIEPVPEGQTVKRPDAVTVDTQTPETAPEPEPYRVPGRKYALLIGIGDYRKLNPVANTKNDTRLIAQTLFDLGYETQILLDLTTDEIGEAIASHRAKLERSGPAISLVYYAGQGAQIDGKSYMIGVDFENVKERSGLTGAGIPVEPNQTELVDANQAGINLFFYDSSRDDPFATMDTRGTIVLSGLVPAAMPWLNSLIIYSASTGQQALDGVDGRDEYSPFARAVSKAFATPGLDHSEFFRALRNEVIDLTSGRQVPEMQDAMSVSYVLNPTRLPDEPETDPKSRAATALYREDSGQLVPTYEDGSYALLIGESDYEEIGDGRQAWRDLPSVTGEVERLADVLENVHGFEVETVLDPDSAELEEALESFVNRHGVKPNARLMIYMAGHGATTERYGNKIAWFVPRDAPATTPLGPFVNTALNLRRIEEWSEIMEAKHVLWLFDSCFSGAAIKMIESRSEAEEKDGWSVHLHTNPVRRVITAGSENEEVPAESRFTQRLIDILSGAVELGDGTTVTGQQIGAFLREDIVRYTFKQGLPKVTPQSDTIVIPEEEGDIIFRLEPQLVADWQQAGGDQ